MILKKSNTIVLLSSLIFGLTLIVMIINILSVNQKSKAPKTQAEGGELPASKGTEYNISLDSFRIVKQKVEKNQNLALIMKKCGVPDTIIHQLQFKTRPLFDVRKLSAGNTYCSFYKKDSSLVPVYFVYEEDEVSFIVWKLTDSLDVYRDHFPVDTIRKSIAGVIRTSLWLDMVRKEANPSLIHAFTEIYAWQVDFFMVKEGDCFKVIFEEIISRGKVISTGRIFAAMYQSGDNKIFAIPFNQNEKEDYFDENGNCLRKMLLKAPLKYSRISSGFSHSRLHPILNIRRPHYGVDYSAPSGTPVYSVGDGIVVKAGYAGGGGNTITVRHNANYVSSYMHLSRFAKGVRVGKQVRQGDLIGFVGSTGLSTGPHLDYRIYHNGKAVNPLKLKLPPAESINKSNLFAFNEIKDKLIKELDALKCPE